MRHGIYGTCSICGMVVRNTPIDWHSHECHPEGIALRKNMTRIGVALGGFKDKVRPGGSGTRKVVASELECALIDLETDLARWNEFAAFEGNALA